MAANTKDRIIDAALELFSQNGFDGTNLQEIADSVGIVKSALYRHFSGKEDLWNALLKQMTVYYEVRFGSESNLPEIPTSCDALLNMTMHLIDFTVHDTRIKKVRRLLLIEQFRNEQARELATKHFLTGLEGMFTKIFAGMMENGCLRKEDPAMLAFAYTTPISALIQLCDREPEKEPEAIARMKAFAEHFICTYKNEAEENKDV